MLLIYGVHRSRGRGPGRMQPINRADGSHMQIYSERQTLYILTVKRSCMTKRYNIKGKSELVTDEPHMLVDNTHAHTHTQCWAIYM